MASVEFFNDKIRESGQSPRTLNAYRFAASQIQDAIAYAHIHPNHRGDLFRYYGAQPQIVAEKLDPQSAETVAGMWIGAIACRARQNSVQEQAGGGENISFATIWKGTQLEDLAQKCEGYVSELTPRLNGGISSIDVDKIRKERIKRIHNLDKEFLVFVGINGSGKDFMLGYLEKFLQFIKIPTEIIKMPNPAGTLFPPINDFLTEQKVLKPIAAQMLFLADAFDTEVSIGKLTVLNRFSPIDALVYGPRELQTTILTSHELVDAVMHTIIINRHPIKALESIKKRDNKPRIFEKRLDGMIEQQSRYAELTALPGFRWLTTDFDSKTKHQQIVLSVNRLLSVVQACGILQRTLVKESRFNGYTEADIFIDDAYWDFKNKNRLNL